MQGKVGDHDKTGCSLQCLAAKISSIPILKAPISDETHPNSHQGVALYPILMCFRADRTRQVEKTCAHLQCSQILP